MFPFWKTIFPGLRDFICPYCFEKVSRHEVLFRCVNICVEPDRIRSKFLLCREPVSDDEVVVHSRVFAPRGYPFLRWFKNPHKDVCNCTIPTSIKVCPKCHSQYPHEYEKYPSPTIAIIGAKETGKSHYIATLIKQIYDLESRFGWAVSALNEQTTKNYNQYFKNPLYEKLQILPQTQTTEGNESAYLRDPLLYSLAFPHSNRFRVCTLAFFDTAGEDLNKEEVMESQAKYICNASGIILLLDPLQQEGLRTQLPLQRLATLSSTIDQNAEAGEITERLLRVIRSASQRSRDKKIDIPLAVVFSKMDEFRGIGDFGKSHVYKKSQHEEGFNLAEFNEINENIREWVKEHTSGFIGKTAEFKDVGFFGVSALGQIPEIIGNRQKLKSPPRPMRVEDPFLWLLWKKGLPIKVR